MKIYTKTGYKGTTALFSGTREPKQNIRTESYGTVDERNSNIGIIRSTPEIDDTSKETIIHVQDKLITLGAILANDPKKAVLKSGKDRLNIPKVKEEDVAFLEKEIDRMNEGLPPITHFVLPGGNNIVALCHVARCVCRRAERITTHLAEMEEVDATVIQYLNRLSDYLFVLARKLSHTTQAEEIKWVPEKL